MLLKPRTRQLQRPSKPLLAGLLGIGILAGLLPLAGTAPWAITFELVAILSLGIMSFRFHLRDQRARAARRRIDMLSGGAFDVESYFQQRPEISAILDAKGQILRANAALCALANLPETDIVGRGIYTIGDGEFGFWDEAKAKADAHGVWRQQAWRDVGEGRLHPQQIVVRALYDKDNTPPIGYALDATDVTDLMHAQSELERTASQDPLTGLFNRRYFEAEAQAAIERCASHSGRLGMLVLDLDEFKHLNDSRGHKFGDDVLIHVATTLREIVPLGDVIARLGGDEFVILAEDVGGLDDLRDMAKQIHFALSLPFAMGDETQVLGVSLGASLYPDNGVDFETLLGHADLAMYEAKLGGRNRVSLYSELQDRQNARQKNTEKAVRASELDLAVEDDRFIPYFQPIVNLTTREIVGAEALCRWQHPDRGLILPGKFVSSAESCGRIRNIDRAIILKVCAQMADWRREQRGRLKISVNVSANTVTDPGFVRFLSNCLLDHGLEPWELVLELTESVVLMADERGQHSLDRLRQMGVSVALDDFGTGFSTLSLLKDLPVSRLKIDRSFVTHIDTHDRDREIVNGIIGLGQALGTDVVVEGIETETQAEIVASLGDVQGQGFLFGHPMPASDLAECTNWRCVEAA